MPRPVGTVESDIRRHSGVSSRARSRCEPRGGQAPGRRAAKKPDRSAPRLTSATHPAATAPVPVIVTAAARPRHHAPMRRGIETETFIGLPFSDGALPLADATIVRVDLSAEELRLAGV